MNKWIFKIFVVQSLSHVWLLVTPCTAAFQVSLSFTISQTLLKLLSIEPVMLSNHFILYCPLLLLLSIFPSTGVFFNEWKRWPKYWSSIFASGGQSIGAPSSASVLPMDIQGWFPFGLTGLISLLSKELSKVFCSTTGRRHYDISSLSCLWLLIV